jgi:hypothetical protein
MRPTGRPMPADPRRAPHDWLDYDAGPVVRPYAMIQGRIAPSGGEFDLVAFVVATMPDRPRRTSCRNIRPSSARRGSRSRWSS